MTYNELARWLAGVRPTPFRVAMVRDGKEEDLSIRRGGNVWVRVANTVRSLKGEGVRCYDKQGALVDECRLVEEEDEPTPGASGEMMTAIEGRTFTAAEVAAILAQAQVRTVEVTANAVTRAVERAMAAQAGTTSEAFRQFAEVNKTLVQRVATLEETVQENLETQRAELQEKREEDATEKKLEGMFFKLVEKMGPEGLKNVTSLFNGAPTPKAVTDGSGK